MGRSLSFCANCDHAWPDSCIDASGLCDECREAKGLEWRCPNFMDDRLDECPVCAKAHPGTKTRTYRVVWSSESNDWIATCDQFPSLSWLDDSPSSALDGLLTLLVATAIATPDLFAV